MAQDNNNLIWVDMEMTGLNPDTDRINRDSVDGPRSASKITTRSRSGTAATLRSIFIVEEINIARREMKRRSSPTFWHILWTTDYNETNSCR